MLPAKPTGFAALSPQRQQEHRVKIGGKPICEVFSLDEKTGKLFWITGRRNGKEAFTATCHYGYKVGCFRGKRYFAHRAIFAMSFGYWPKQVDHINGNKIDNRPENLRAATHKQNMRNKRKRKGCTSKYIGVFKKGDVWVAKIRTNGVSTHLGNFEIEKEAALAYDLAAVERDPEFSRLNFDTPRCDHA